MTSPHVQRPKQCLIVNLSFQEARRMRWALMQRAVWVAALVCLCSGMAQSRAQECGDNPMKQVLLVAKRSGRSLTHVLTLLRDIDGGAYDTLSQKFRLYAACVGLVDTGYFRKRSGATLPMDGRHYRQSSREETSGHLHPRYTGHRIRVRDIEIANSELPFPSTNDDDGKSDEFKRVRAPQSTPKYFYKPSREEDEETSQPLLSLWRAAGFPGMPRKEIRLWLSQTQANLTSALKGRRQSQGDGFVRRDEKQLR